jgi:hypothetical protein
LSWRFPQNLAYPLIAYMEDIEREHLLAHSGWEKYKQSIYVDHYHQHHPRNAGMKKKQWQQYKPAAPDKVVDVTYTTRHE